MYMHQVMIRALLITLAFAAISCSSRVVYDSVSPTPTGVVNINLATVDELTRLPGIGRKTAEAVVSYRTQFGRFRRPESLLQVRGISESRFTEIKPYITVE